MDARAQLRAVLLAAIIVVSMVGGGATAIAGADTVEKDSPGAEISTPEIVQPDDRLIQVLYKIHRSQNPFVTPTVKQNFCLASNETLSSTVTVSSQSTRRR